MRRIRRGGAGIRWNRRHKSSLRNTAADLSNRFQQNKKGGSALLPPHVVPEKRVYFSFASVSLMALKFGSSFGVGVCSLYCTTPPLSMTKAARAEVSPTPASI